MADYGGVDVWRVWSWNVEAKGVSVETEWVITAIVEELEACSFACIGILGGCVTDCAACHAGGLTLKGNHGDGAALATAESAAGFQAPRRK